MKRITILTLFAVAGYAQPSSSTFPATDAQKIADAVRAGPEFVTKDATILDWPSTPGGEYRVLRKGTSEWTCLTGIPGYPHDEPGCFDRVFVHCIQEGLAGRKANIDRVGISYMYAGAWVPGKSGGKGGTAKDFHVGPHVMIITPNQDELKSMNRDATTGMPYVTHLPKQTDLFLVIPIRQWSDITEARRR